MARDPRVVLGDRSLEALSKFLDYYGDPYEAPQNGYVLVDADGRAFVNYLYAPIGMEADADEVARIVTSTLDIEQVFEKFSAEVKKLVDFDRMVVHEIDTEAGVSTG